MTGILQVVIGVAMIVAGIFVVPPAIIGLLLGGIALIASGAFFIYLSVPSKQARKARSRGEKAKATVLSVKRTSAGYAANPMYELELEVRPRTGSPYIVKRKVLASRHKPPEQGEEIDVRITDSSDPEAIELD